MCILPGLFSNFWTSPMPTLTRLTLRKVIATLVLAAITAYGGYFARLTMESPLFICARAALPELIFGRPPPCPLHEAKPPSASQPDAQRDAGSGSPTTSLKDSPTPDDSSSAAEIPPSASTEGKIALANPSSPTEPVHGSNIVAKEPSKPGRRPAAQTPAAGRNPIRWTDFGNGRGRYPMFE